eukprot:TRINITY_DN21944_c0_g1_i1.p1 TRINITY_DN21944_c0_g1~~TRINITY_DN21944_c0_g1_i1.p1  ORF type:complete len:779 (-),score=68.71 TRINITY_DN21944_c0_g1_i1:10-2292(-)
MAASAAHGGTKPSQCQYQHCTVRFGLTARGARCPRCGLIFCRTHISQSLYWTGLTQITLHKVSAASRKRRVCLVCWDDMVRQSEAGNGTTQPLYRHRSLNHVLDDQTPSYVPVASCHWIDCLILVKFDLHVGQVVDFSVPQLSMSPAAEKALSFMAFPDANVFDDVHVLFSFVFDLALGQPSSPEQRRASLQLRVPLPGDDAYESSETDEASPSPNGGSSSNTTSSNSSESDTNEEVKGKARESDSRRERARGRGAHHATSKRASNSWPDEICLEPDGKHNPLERYGYVYYRQKKDRTVERGAVQRALILLSAFPFAGFFLEVAQKCGTAVFHETVPVGQERPVIESLVQQILVWPAPLPDRTYELPLLGDLIKFRTPRYEPLMYCFAESDADALPTTMPERPKARVVLPPYSPLTELSLHAVFYQMLPYLWKLWEIIICGEPLCVYGPCSATNSHTVLALASLIAPLEFGGMLRPFTTINSSEIPSISKPEDVQGRSLIIGVANPHFPSHFCLEWPHQLCVAPLGKTPAATAAAHLGRPPPKLDVKVDNKGREDILGNENALNRLYTTRKQFAVRTVKDTLRATSKVTPSWPALSTPWERTMEDPLRVHFEQLTKEFLRPLEDCFSAIWTQQAGLAFLPAEELRHILLPSTFLDHVRKHGVSERHFKAKFVEPLYRAFLRGPHFLLWIGTKVRAARRLDIMKSSREFILRGKSPIELDALYRRIGQILERELAGSATDLEYVAQLRSLHRGLEPYALGK